LPAVPNACSASVLSYCTCQKLLRFSSVKIKVYPDTPTYLKELSEATIVTRIKLKDQSTVDTSNTPHIGVDCKAIQGQYNQHTTPETVIERFPIFRPAIGIMKDY